MLIRMQSQVFIVAQNLIRARGNRSVTWQIETRVSLLESSDSYIIRNDVAESANLMCNFVTHPKP
jgi:hypothetical protein